MTEAQIRERVNSNGNLANRFSLKESTVLTSRPGNACKKRLPTFIKNTVAIMAQVKSDIQENIGSEFGVTQQAVSQIHTGVTHSDKAAVDGGLKIIKDLAMDRLINVLGLLDDDKLADTKAKDLSSIASNLSNVVHRATPQEKIAPTAGVGVSISIYTPQLKSEEEYVTHEVSVVD